MSTSVKSGITSNSMASSTTPYRPVLARGSKQHGTGDSILIGADGALLLGGTGGGTTGGTGGTGGTS